MSVLNFISQIAKPVVDIVDELNTSEDEKNQVRLAMSKLEADMNSKVLELEGKRLDHDTKMSEAKSRVIQAEAESKYAISAIWRPLVMLSFALCIIVSTFGHFWGYNIELPDKFWEALMLGLGGYLAVGRTAEKITKTVALRKVK